MTILNRMKRGACGARSISELPFPALRSEMNRLFDEFVDGLTGESEEGGGAGDFTPVVDVRETDTAIKVVAELPGLTEEDIQLEVDETTLTLSGEKKAEEEAEEDGSEAYWREVRFGHFRRTIQLPAEVDPEKAKARFSRGALRVTLPKIEAEKSRKHSVEITSE